MKREIQVDKAYSFTKTFYDHGVAKIPDSASFVIRDNGGTSVASDNCTINSTTGEITASFAAVDNDEIARNYKIDYTVNIDGETSYYNELFDVVYTPLSNQATDNDAFLKLPELRSSFFERTFKSTESGSINEIVCSNLNQDQRSYLGAQIEILVSDTDSHEARVISYESSSGSMIFSPSYTSAIATDTVFRVRPSFSIYLDDAFEKVVKRDIRNHVGVAAKYIDSNVVVNLTVMQALADYCFAQIEAEDDKWSLRAKGFAQKYKDEFQALGDPVDTDEDGNISDSENADRPSLSNTELVV